MLRWRIDIYELITICVQEEGLMNHDKAESAHLTLVPQRKKMTTIRNSSPIKGMTMVILKTNPIFRMDLIKDTRSKDPAISVRENVTTKQILISLKHDEWQKQTRRYTFTSCLFSITFI